MTAETILSVLCEIATRYDKSGKEYAPVKENPPPAATGEGAKKKITYER